MSQFSVPWQPKREYAYGIFARAIIRVAKGLFGLATPFVSRFPAAILVGAIVAVCLVVWFHALVFGYVDVHILGAVSTNNEDVGSAGRTISEFSYFSPSTWGLPPSMIKERMIASGGWAVPLAGLLQYPIWPVQFGFVRDLFGLGALFGLFNLVPA